MIAVPFLAIAPWASSCSPSDRPTAPTAAISTPVLIPPSPTGGDQIKGTVSDSALRPIAGARVEFVDGPQSGSFAMTDETGEFFLVGNVDDATRFRASKEGHVTAEAQVLPNCDRCNPHRWVHFYLDVLASPADLAGDYTLTFIAANSCTNLPEALRTRTYEATIALGDFTWPGSRPGVQTAFKVTPRGSTFPDGLNFFWLNVAGDFVTVTLGDHTDPGVTERVGPNTYFAFHGAASVSVGSPVSSISTPFSGWIDYCVNPAMGDRYDCTPGPMITNTRCDSTRHQLTLARR